MARRLLMGAAIEGVVGASGKPLALCWGAHAPHPSTSYEWRQALAGPPSEAAATIDPLVAASLSGGGCTLLLPRSPSLAAMLLYDDQIAAHALVQTVGQQMTFQPTPADGAHLFLGAETIRIDVGDFSSGSSLVTRAIAGTEQQAHEDGTRAYARPPWWIGRGVTLLTHDADTGEEVERGRHRIAARSTDAATITIELEPVAVLSLRERANRDPIDLGRRGDLVWRAGIVEGTPRRDDGRARGAGTGTISGVRGAVQIAGALVTYGVNSLRGMRIEARDGAGVLGSSADVGEPDRPLEPWTEPVWDVLAYSSDPEDGLQAFHVKHPAAMARSLLTSIGSEGRWSAGVRDAALSAALKDLEEETPGASIDQLVLGWGGADFAPGEEAAKILAGLGVGLGMAQDGRLAAARWRILDLDGLEESAAAPIDPYRDGGPAWEDPPASGAALAEVTIGALPWSDPVRVTVTDARLGRRASTLDSSAGSSLDLPYYKRSRAPEIARRVAAARSAGAVGLPRVTVRAPDRPAGYDHGAHVALRSLGIESPWLVDPASGEVTELAPGSPALAGQIVGRRYVWEAGHYELTLLMTGASGSYARRRAPAAVVEDLAAPDVVEIRPAEVGVEGGDGTAFEVGDEIELCDRWLAPRGPAGTITSRNNTFLNVTPDAALAGATAGDVIRLAPSADYNSTRSAITHRPFSYQAGSSGTIAEQPGGASPPDVYGGGLGASPSGEGERTGDRFSGADFVGIDAAAYEPGASRPQGSGLALALRSQLVHAALVPDRVSLPLTVGDASDVASGASERPWGTRGGAAYVCLPWLCQRGLYRVSVALAGATYQTSASTAATLNLDVELDAGIAGSRGRGASPLARGVSEIDVLLARPLEGPLAADLVIRATSPPGPVDPERDGGLGRAQLSYSGARLTLGQRTDGTYGSSGAAVAPIWVGTAAEAERTYTSAEGLTDWDHLHWHSGYVAEVRPQAPLQGSNAGQIAVRELLTARVESLSIACHHAPASYVPGAAAYVPGRTVEGADEAELMAARAAIRTRARCLWAGPRPDPATGARFRRRSGGGAGWILEATVAPRTERPRLVICMNILASRPYDPSIAPLVEPNLDRLVTVAWEWFVRCARYAGGAAPTGSGAAFEIRAVRAVDHWLQSHGPYSPALQIERLIEEGVARPAGEGRLYPEDRSLLTRVELELDAPSLGGYGAPEPLVIQVSPEATQADIAAGPDLDASAIPPSSLRMALVGATIWEVPRG